MSADVPHHQRRATSHRVVPPGKPVGRVRVVLIGFATLDILHLHQPDLTELTILDHGLRLTDQGITRVVVGETEDETGLLHTLHQVESLVQRVGYRLVADHVETMLESRRCIFVMAVVGSHYRDHVCSVPPRCLGLDEPDGRAIGAVFRQAEASAGSPGAIRVRR